LLALECLLLNLEFGFFLAHKIEWILVILIFNLGICDLRLSNIYLVMLFDLLVQQKQKQQQQQQPILFYFN